MYDDTFFRQTMELRFELHVKHYYNGPQNQVACKFLRHLIVVRDVTSPIAFEGLQVAGVIIMRQPICWRHISCCCHDTVCGFTSVIRMACHKKQLNCESSEGTSRNAHTRTCVYVFETPGTLMWCQRCRATQKISVSVVSSADVIWYAIRR